MLSGRVMLSTSCLEANALLLISVTGILRGSLSPPALPKLVEAASSNIYSGMFTFFISPSNPVIAANVLPFSVFTS